MSAAAVRELVAREARQICRREVEATVVKLARSPQWLALSAEEQVRATVKIELTGRCTVAGSR